MTGEQGPSAAAWLPAVPGQGGSPSPTQRAAATHSDVDLGAASQSAHFSECQNQVSFHNATEESLELTHTHTHTRK